MKSYEVLKESIAPQGAKSVSADMGLSTSLIYKWCEANDTAQAAGADNPLDRVARLCRITGSVDPIHWLCEQMNCYCVINPPNKQMPPSEVFEATRRLLKEFSDVLSAVTASMVGDSQIDCEEAARIRKEWEELKRLGENFVAASESGCFQNHDEAQ